MKHTNVVDGSNANEGVQPILQNFSPSQTLFKNFDVKDTSVSALITSPVRKMPPPLPSASTRSRPRLASVVEENQENSPHKKLSRDMSLKRCTLVTNPSVHGYGHCEFCIVLVTFEKLHNIHPWTCRPLTTEERNFNIRIDDDDADLLAPNSQSVMFESGTVKIW